MDRAHCYDTMPEGLYTCHENHGNNVAKRSEFVCIHEPIAHTVSTWDRIRYNIAHSEKLLESSPLRTGRAPPSPLSDYLSARRTPVNREILMCSRHSLPVRTRKQKSKKIESSCLNAIVCARPREMRRMSSVESAVASLVSGGGKTKWHLLPGQQGQGCKKERKRKKSNRSNATYSYM